MRHDATTNAFEKKIGCFQNQYDEDATTNAFEKKIGHQTWIQRSKNYKTVSDTQDGYKGARLIGRTQKQIASADVRPHVFGPPSPVDAWC